MPEYLFDHLELIRRRLGQGHHLCLFLDYDGTLLPVSDRRDPPKLPEDLKARLEHLSQSPLLHLTIISGRSCQELRRLAGSEGPFLAGNHGLEVVGRGMRWMPRAAREWPTRVAALCWALNDELPAGAEVWVENKVLSATLHLSPHDQERSGLERLVDQVLEAHGGRQAWRVTPGKQVIELFPDPDWHKGRAVEAMLKYLHRDGWSPTVLPLYFGDDWTDEEAFKVLGQGGLTVVIGPLTRQTAAGYLLHRPEETATFLEWLEGEVTGTDPSRSS